MFGYFFVKHQNRKVDPFLNGLLEALGGRLGRFPGALGVLFGGPVFQIHCKKQYITHVFKKAALRHLSSLGPLSGAILAHFEELWTSKFNEQIIKNW